MVVRDASLTLQRLSTLSTKEDLSDLSIPNITEGAEDVAGLRGRIRLKKDNSRNWMEQQRKYLQAYEYLCHIGEAKDWIEACLEEEIAPIVELEEALRNGIILAKLARWFAPPCVRRIFLAPKLQYRHSDNINAFLEAIKKLELPSYFWFELTDLYEKKNVPKVIYCIHALSYLLSRRGLAPCVKNLVGQLEFADEVIQATQEGLQKHGDALPSFRNISSALSHELREPILEDIVDIYEEPEPTEEEDFDLYWANHKDDIIRCQRLIRTWIARQAFLDRQFLHRQLIPFIIAVQAQSRGVLARRAFRRRLHELFDIETFVVKMQARIRGKLAREALRHRLEGLYSLERIAVKLQSRARGALARQELNRKLRVLFHSDEVVVNMQARIRGMLVRREFSRKLRGLIHSEPDIINLQARIRGLLARKNFAKHLYGLFHVEPTVVKMQACARGVLVRREFGRRLHGLFDTETVIMHIQARARGALARREFGRKLRGLFHAEPCIIKLQARARGVLARRSFALQRDHFAADVAKIVKIQSLYRAKLAENAYRQLTTGSNPPVSTIKNFVHLLNDSNFDFDEELTLETHREKVVRLIRENRSLDSHLNELDLKIGLLVKNRISLDEVLKLSKRQRRRMSHIIASSKSAHDAVGGVSLKGLDADSRRRLELYQQLFYLLQTQPQYLSRLLCVLGQSDKVNRTMETIVLTLFGYAQNAREEYLLLNLLQSCIREELKPVENIQEFMRGNFMFLKLVLHYYRGAKERKYLRDLFAPLINKVLEDDFLDLETNPVEIYKTCINNEESRTGRPTTRPLNVSAEEAVMNDEETKATFIQHLQRLRVVTEEFLSAILGSLEKMPYGIRLIARELKDALGEKFPDEPESEVMKVIGNFVYYRYINPAIIAPETFDVVERVINPQQRKNLGQVAKMLHQIARGKPFMDGEGEMFFAPLNSYVLFSAGKFTEWFQAVTQVKNAESYFQMDHFLDITTTRKPIIYISPAEIFSMHGMLMDHLQEVAPLESDPLRIILKDLGPSPPVDENTQQNDISLTLVDRFASEVDDPDADINRLFVETKRLVLTVIRVQKGSNLVEILTKPVTPADESAYAELERVDDSKGNDTRPGSSLHTAQSFLQLKRHTLENVLRLEAEGRITRENHYQDILNAIATDIRNKHRRRVQRDRELKAIRQTLANLEEKRRYLDEQRQSYYNYIEACMENLKNSRGRRNRYVLPFTRQYFHLRNLQRQGKVPRFGSYKYSAARLHEQGVLLAIEGVSERQFERIMLTISSDELGVFRVEAAFTGLGISGGVVELRLEDLLQCQFNNVQTMELFDGAARINVNLLLFLINRKFFV
ncbi:uncharacterized protein VTP21DRAFT_10736 [Calcarisporiella thermophila]|uniref:uncharacterized protein n=1 Tax=Calcarisporiella thermophila TaxID=911321 RepID=UPI003744A711